MAHETTPLLHPGKHKHQAHWVLFLVCIVIVTIDFGGALSAAPQTQILEDIVCHALHRDAVISAATCKGADVQSELALIIGWKETFDQIPGIILALPYGFMADRVGRRQVAMMSMLGLTMQEVAVQIICWSLFFPLLYYNSETKVVYFQAGKVQGSLRKPSGLRLYSSSVAAELKSPARWCLPLCRISFLLKSGWFTRLVIL